MAKTISVCIPVYNESQNLPVAVAALEEVFRSLLPGYRLEIIVTDNASTDETWKIAQGLAATKSHLKAYRFSRNFGYQNSVFAGLTVATGDAVVEMDADLEDPPQVIPEFVRKWEEGFDVAYGVRGKRHSPLVMRILFATFYRILHRLSDLNIPENSGDFRLLDRKVVDVLKALPERNLYLRGLVSYLGFKQTPVLYDRQPRHSGQSKFKLWNYLMLAVDAVTAFSKAPLRMIGVAGLLLFIVSSIMAAYYLIAGLTRHVPVQGFTTLVILILILNSITFMFLGMIGEYLSRIFDDSKFRPRVIIAESANAPDAPKFL
jgi:dolichol-phosphate mannosyltransferase